MYSLNLKVLLQSRLYIYIYKAGALLFASAAATVVKRSVRLGIIYGHYNRGSGSLCFARAYLRYAFCFRLLPARYSPPPQSTLTPLALKCQTAM